MEFVQIVIDNQSYNLYNIYIPSFNIGFIGEGHD